jgi:hypothetical protein
MNSAMNLLDHSTFLLDICVIALRYPFLLDASYFISAVEL